MTISRQNNNQGSERKRETLTMMTQQSSSGISWIQRNPLENIRSDILRFNEKESRRIYTKMLIMLKEEENTKNRT